MLYIIYSYIWINLCTYLHKYFFFSHFRGFDAREYWSRGSNHNLDTLFKIFLHLKSLRNIEGSRFLGGRSAALLCQLFSSCVAQAKSLGTVFPRISDSKLPCYSATGALARREAILLLMGWYRHMAYRGTDLRLDEWLPWVRLWVSSGSFPWFLLFLSFWAQQWLPWSLPRSSSQHFLTLQSLYLTYLKQFLFIDQTLTGT